MPRPDWNEGQIKHMGIRTLCKQLWKEEEGQDLVEYALVGALLALASVAALNTLATDLQTAFINAVSNVSTTTT
jgi:pilus assembly protein Flp/PilA